MKYWLDTNVCIRYLRTPLSQVAQKIAAVAPSDIALSAITVGELFRGAYRSIQVEYNLAQITIFVGQFQCLSLDYTAAPLAGRIDADLMARGLRIGPYGTLIAAIALAYDLTLVTQI